MVHKWIFFCETFERSSLEPSQADAIAYLAWLATHGAYADRESGPLGSPMAFSSIRGYIQQLGRFLVSNHGARYESPTSSLQMHWALMSVKRRLGDLKQRARAISMLEIIIILENVTGEPEFVNAFRFIVLLTYLGAYQIGGSFTA